MLVPTGLSLNILLASIHSLPASSAHVPNNNLPTTTTFLYSTEPEKVGEKKADEKAVDEDFVVVGDPLKKELKGKLKGAFEAYEKGDFELAERQFSRLANRQFVRAQNQRFAELVAPNELPLPLNRGASFSPDRWNALSETPVSASRAIARAQDVAYSTARLDAAASKLFFLKGVAQVRQGKNSEALKSYRQALRLHKENVDARIEYTLLLLRQNDLAASAEQLKKLAQAFNAKCTNNRCRYAPESKKRYNQIQLAYSNIITRAN